MGKVVVPGSFLGRAEETSSGFGTYVRSGEVYSALSGEVRVNGANQYEVSAAAGKQVVVPTVGSVVTGRVVRINSRFATVEILVVDAAPVASFFKGIIRVQDVRATDVDKVEISRSFRPADIVVAEIISLGDRQSYFLSTAKNHLGVIYAECRTSGEPMYPISWEQMQCPKTDIKEFRKVSKVVPDP